MANNILNYLGNPIGKSIKEGNCESIIDEIFKTAKNYSCSITYPKDVKVGKSMGDKAQIKELNEVTVNDFILYCSAHFFATSGNLSAQAIKLILLK